MAIRKRKENNNDDKAEPLSSSSSSTAAATTDHPRKRYMGVRQSPSGRWVAEIKGTAQKIRLWLGTFDRAEQAALAYDEAACLLRGPNTRTNFWPRSAGRTHNTPSILPAKVFNHLLRHIETQRTAPSLPPPSMPLPPSQQQQIDNQSEIEPINRIAYGDQLLSEFSNTESDCLRDQQKAREEEVDKGVDFVGRQLRSKEKFSCFDAPFEMSMVMEEGSRKEEMGAYEYWLMLSYAAKN